MMRRHRSASRPTGSARLAIQIRCPENLSVRRTEHERIKRNKAIQGNPIFRDLPRDLPRIQTSKSNLRDVHKQQKQKRR